MPAARRFPPPCFIEEHTESFIVKDANGQALAYVYFEDEKGRRDAMKRLTRDEAGRSRSTSPSCRSYCGNEAVDRAPTARPHHRRLIADRGAISDLSNNQRHAAFRIRPGRGRDRLFGTAAYRCAADHYVQLPEPRRFPPIRQVDEATESFCLRDAMKFERRFLNFSRFNGW